MKIIVCEPNVPPYVKLINGKYEELRDLIGQKVKPLTLNHPHIIIMCNKELYENGNGHGRMNIPGTFIFIGRNQDRLRSLLEEEIIEIIDTIRREDLTLI